MKTGTEGDKIHDTAGEAQYHRGSSSTVLRRIGQWWERHCPIEKLRLIDQCSESRVSNIIINKNRDL